MNMGIAMCMKGRDVAHTFVVAFSGPLRKEGKGSLLSEKQASRHAIVSCSSVGPKISILIESFGLGAILTENLPPYFEGMRFTDQ